MPVNGRLDQQRYKYAAWRPNPLRGFHMAPEEVAVELARRYFRWIGPATLAEFQWFSALGVKAAKAAIEPLKLEPLAKDDPRMMLPGDREKFEAFQIPKQAQYALVSSLDGLSLLRRDLKGLLDSADLDRSVYVEKGTMKLGEPGRLAEPRHLRSRPAGRFVGVRHRDGVARLDCIHSKKQGPHEGRRRNGSVRPGPARRRAFLQPRQSEEPRATH